MLIYTTHHSLYCAKLRIVLRHKRIAFDEEPPPGGGGSEEYLGLVPSGNIPALIDGTLTLTDSEAIAEYLEEKHTLVRMLPDTIVGRALSRERSRFADTRLEPALRLTFPHVDPKTRNAASVLDAHAMIETRLKALGEMLHRSSLPRDQLWLGDPGTIVTLAWISLFEGPVIPRVTWPQAVLKYLSDMQCHPAVSQELERYFPEMLGYLANKGITPKPDAKHGPRIFAGLS